MNLTEAIVVKISHDLAGGIGAMASTTELMEIDPTFVNEAGTMLKQNSLMLMARLRFYRALFGAETKEINTNIVSDYLKTWGQKITFEGKVENRLQLSLVAVGIILLVQGGTLSLNANQLTLKGKEIVARPDFQSALQGENTPIIPETLEAHWLLNQLSEQKKKLVSKLNAKSGCLEIK
ncbi:MAG: hypothetical protein IKQ99_01940 [Alphaproteobacteria bacterium]|nr:hypothetical protein [Alphaproteobacteria bacterium]